jgi:hypothetical protein
MNSLSVCLSLSLYLLTHSSSSDMDKMSPEQLEEAFASLEIEITDLIHDGDFFLKIL